MSIIRVSPIFQNFMRMNIMRKSLKISLVILVAVLVLSTAFAAGCLTTLSTTTAAVKGLNSDLINQAWKILSNDYVQPEKIDSTVLTQGAIQGMVQAVDDPYSYYLNPREYKLTQGDFASSFGGIGATLNMNKDKQPIIVNTLPNTPAEKAGLKSNDIILAVDGKTTQNLTTDQVVSLVRGDAGTKVKLLILHEGDKLPVEIEIIRAEINPNSVASRMEGDIAYIQISNFHAKTNIDFQAALKALDLTKAKGIILDLRNNPGGYVNVVVDIASHFIKEGVIITMRDNQGKTKSTSVNPNGTFTALPIVVLVNQYSASGSEVLSGALQDYGRATIAGTVTFGKGSYDSFFPLPDGSAIYLTIGRWLTPKGREIEGKGITPDITLTQTGDEAVKWAVDYLHQAKP
jgi:carboxyl-terminal processing protease